MSPYPAIRRHGICSGSLWKSHCRPFKGTGSELHLGSVNNGGIEGQKGAVAAENFSFDGILAEANERERTHEFCVLVGNCMLSYSDVWAYSKGDPPTSEIKIVGASAWNPPSTISKSHSIRHTSTFTAEHQASSLSELVVSPSALSSKSTDFLIVTSSGTHVQCSAPSSSDRDEWLAALHAGLEGSFLESRLETLMVLSKSYADDESFNVEKLQNVEICNNISEGKTKADMLVKSVIANVMSAFQLETSSIPLVPPPPQIEARNARLARRGMKATGPSEGDSSYSYSSFGGSSDTITIPHSTGYLSPCDDWSIPPSETHCTACGHYPPQHALRIDAAPLPEYGMEVRVDLCHNCAIAQSVLRHVRYLGWLYEVEARGRAAIRLAWNELKTVMSHVATDCADKLVLDSELEEDSQRKNGENFLESSEDQEFSSFGSLMHLSHSESLEDVSLNDSEHADKVKSTSHVKSSSSNLHPSYDSTSAPAYIDALMKVLQTTKFAEFRRRSSMLDALCMKFEERGKGCASEFVESVEECAKASASSCFYGVHDVCIDGVNLEGSHHKQQIRLKKEAFKVAGDMNSALKLLYDYALPLDRNITFKSNASFSHLKGNADMLAAILEFFLDLCDEGQMDAVAFFWPQLCHIHMQMLPPRDTEELKRVELMEDFLLTVATRYSVHLALDLVWGLLADLEESLSSSSCNAQSRRRRSSVLRFISELESLLFDFEGGWGGGGVSLHGMLSPSEHQSVLLRDAMTLVQLYRRFGSHYLTRSVRLDKLRKESVESLGEYPTVIDDGGKVKSRIAKNAAYFSSHIIFSRKLGDIAEKLRFTEPHQRSQMLRAELKDLNSHGKVLGGDPLNRIRGDGVLFSTVHLPPNEGHVFRSKERTPVLLLVELIIKDSFEANNIQLKHFMTEQENQKKDVEENYSDEQLTIENSCSPNASPGTDQKYVQDGRKCYTGIISDENFGKHTHGVLTLTPRVSEATNVTDEGKEMMADLIANLIEEQQSKGLGPLPLVNDTKADPIPLKTDCDSEATGHNSISNDVADFENNEMYHEVAFSLKAPNGKPSGRKREYARKISALGSIFPDRPSDLSRNTGIHLPADSQFRRDVLFAIMERGMRGNNVIARGAAAAARRAVQTMDRNRAIALLHEPTADDSATNDKHCAKMSTEGIIVDSNRQRINGIVINTTIDEDEVMEALRLLIIQNRVAQENLSNNAAVMIDDSETDLTESSSVVTEQGKKGVDAGEVDPRLAGCGRISSSILSALRLWKGGIVSNFELLELVQKDLQFVKQSAIFDSSNEKKLIEDSAFWGRFSFGERWAEKKARLASSSPHGSSAGWDLIGCIVKSNDDLRQEAFIMQLIELCAEAFQAAGLDLWIHPYEIVATGRSTGFIECVRNAMSFDSLKKRPGYGTEGLVGHFKRMTEIAADPVKALNEAKQNFVSSLAAYSLMSYLFMFKDRHNGNLLLDTAGHVIHIDFGFVFGIAPGGSFSLEQSTPFKLTDEMLEVMEGVGSPLFSEFVTLFCCGFLALQAHADTFLTVVEIMCKGSNFPCFNVKDPADVISKLRERFCPELNKSQTVAFALDLIKFATTSYGTKQYDYFQYLSQGIAT